MFCGAGGDDGDVLPSRLVTSFGIITVLETASHSWNVKECSPDAWLYAQGTAPMVAPDPKPAEASRTS